MQYRQLGQTDMQVSCLSYGASPLGSVFRSVNEDTGIRTVHTATTFTGREIARIISAATRHSAPATKNAGR